MIYVLGANGFVGSKICSYLYDFDEPFQAVTRLGNSNHKYEEICLSQFMMILKTKKVKIFYNYKRNRNSSPKN